MGLKDNLIITLEDVKNFLKVEHDADDDLIEKLVNAAAIKAEQVTNRSFDEEDDDEVLDAIEVWIMQRVARIYQRRIEGLSSESVLGLAASYGKEELDDLMLHREEPGF
jgi:uncharacterized phage protein (predicted DNA packaging)